MATPEIGPVLARRLLAAYVTAIDPDAVISASTWRESVGHYQRLQTALHRHPWRDSQIIAGLTQLSAAPAEAVTFRSLVTRIAAEPAAAAADELLAALIEVDQNSLVTYHLGARYRASSPPAGDTEPVTGPGALGASAPPQRGGPSPDLAVVVPVRARPEDTGRLRNTVAALTAANRQTLDRSRYVLVAVEQDTEPRCRALIEDLVDEYLFAPNPGAFNKSWALNIGVAAGRNATYLCLLDADILVETDHFDRMVADLSQGPPALLPFGDLLNLDRASSDRAIRRRLGADAVVPFDELRGFGLRDVWGACVGVTRALYEEIGGYDERFRGWGDEDNEFYRQLLPHTRVPRWSRPVAHLWHARPRMLNPDGRRPNQHLSRTPRPATREPIGALTKYLNEPSLTTGDVPA